MKFRGFDSYYVHRYHSYVILVEHTVITLFTWTYDMQNGKLFNDQSYYQTQEMLKEVVSKTNGTYYINFQINDIALYLWIYSAGSKCSVRA